MMCNSIDALENILSLGMDVEKIRAITLTLMLGRDLKNHLLLRESRVIALKDILLLQDGGTM